MNNLSHGVCLKQSIGVFRLQLELGSSDINRISVSNRIMASHDDKNKIIAVKQNNNY